MILVATYIMRYGHVSDDKLVQKRISQVSRLNLGLLRHVGVLIVFPVCFCSLVPIQNEALKPPCSCRILSTIKRARSCPSTVERCIKKMRAIIFMLLYVSPAGHDVSRACASNESKYRQNARGVLAIQRANLITLPTVPSASITLIPRGWYSALVR